MAKVVKLTRLVNQYVLQDGGQKFCNESAYQVEGEKGDKVFFLGKFLAANMPVTGSKIFLAVKSDLTGAEVDQTITALPAGFRVVQHYSGWTLPTITKTINEIVADVALTNGWSIYKLSDTEYVFKAELISEKEYQIMQATMYWIGNASITDNASQSVEL